MSHGIFISYRRDDTSGFAGRLFDRLLPSFPREQLFIDIDSIEPGANFANVLSDKIGDCDVLLALIGPRWLNSMGADGSARLSDPKDFVRIEIEAALKRNVRVIPLLLEGARMPTAEHLPDAIRDLAQRQAVEISHNRFDADVEMLIRTLRRLIKTPAEDNSLSAIDRVGKTRANPLPEAETEVPALPTKPSIAVLPFQNMSGDAEQEYFADGISEDLITGLSKLRWFFVIARNSSFSYKSKAVDVKQIARELGVRYVLEGSVRKGGNRLRITAQLIDAATNNHIWADRFDGELNDIFALQDEITKKVVAAIEPKLLEAEGVRSQIRSSEDLGAWDLVMKASSHLWRQTKTDSEAAIAMLKKAAERYPDYAPAHSMLALALLFRTVPGETSRSRDIKDAAALALRAAELDDTDPWAHLALGYADFLMRRTDQAVEEFQRAIEINPNFAAAYGYLGHAFALDGQSDQAIPQLELALRMSPQNPQNATFYVGLATAHYLAGRFAEALGFANKAMKLRSGWTPAIQIYCACLAQTGQLDQARAALDRLKELHPAISVAWIEQNTPWKPGPMEKFVEGMRKAGLE